MKSKYILKTLVILLFVFNVTAQQGINYKAMIKDANGDAIANTAITVQFTILENGTTDVFKETHNPTTDANGIIIVNIGEGTLINGDFNSIDWGSNSHYLNTKIDSGNGLTDMDTTKFKPVPDALSARVVGGIKNPSDTSGLGQKQYPKKTKRKKDGFGNKSRTVLVPRIINNQKKRYIYKYVRDVNLNIYSTVLVGKHIWMDENLRTTKYNDGSEIRNQDVVVINSIGAYYSSDAVRSGKLCPVGWHVPTNEEWNMLVSFLINNGYGYQGSSNDIAKSLAINRGWDNSSIIGTVGYEQGRNNGTGFSGIPTGYFPTYYNPDLFDPPISAYGKLAIWWTSTANSSNLFWIRSLSWESGELKQNAHRDLLSNNLIALSVKYCVRCIKD